MDTYVTSPHRPSVASRWKLVVALMCSVWCTVTIVPSVWSQDGTSTLSGETPEGGSPTSAGLQAGAFVTTLVYTPLKTAFALAGGIVGGLGYVFSGGNLDAAKTIWTTSLYGTYLLTADHLQGNRPIRFFGVAESQTVAEPSR